MRFALAVIAVSLPFLLFGLIPFLVIAAFVAGAVTLIRSSLSTEADA